jgi:hypothetical protein
MTAGTLQSDRWIATTRSLGWAGLIPFFILPISQFLIIPAWTSILLISYAMLILAFLCGTLWLRQLRSPTPSPTRLLASNIILLAVWPAILLPPSWATGLLAVGFGAHLAVEPPWTLRDLPTWYRRMRLSLSTLAIALLSLTSLIGLGRGL